MLELFQPEGAFEALEAYLAEELWGREGRVADVFLGYGLSQSIRRDPARLRPEPCPFPLLACRVREENPSRSDKATDCHFLGFGSDRGRAPGPTATTWPRWRTSVRRSRAATSTR